MQVSQQDDHITHAVIGNQESISMGMSDDAALMHILSSTLYTYPKLAAVREVICNGWDAHISAKKTDTPLQITLTPTQLTIRDFGSGIHHDNIGPIYGVYGNSTKRTDTTVTGGFGLGSKAPFAYTDNFELVSCHQGVRTVYRVSKSSMERGGKPSINKIISTPTDETGISISFGIQNGDAPNFGRLIKEVLYLGGIKASINSRDPEEVLPLENSPTGYIIHSFQGTLTSKINVRYGNVVYPVPCDTAFQDEWAEVVRQVKRLWDGANIVFMVPPDSVSIAPNREALIFTENTVATVKEALAKFKVEDLKNASIAVGEIKQYSINKHIQGASPTSFQEFKEKLEVECLNVRELKSAHGIYAYTMKRAYIASALRKIPSEDLNGLPTLVKKLEHAVRTKAVNSKFAKELRKAILTSDSKEMGSALNSVFYRHVTYPLYQVLPKYPLVKAARIRYNIPHQRASNSYWRRDSINYHAALEASAFLFKRVLLVRTEGAEYEFFYRTNRQDKSGWLIYRAVFSPQHLEQARAMFKELGYEIHENIPEVKPKEIDPNAPPKVVKPRAPKLEGYVPLSKCFDPKEERYLSSYGKNNTGPIEGITDPVAWVRLWSKSESCHRIGQLSSTQSKALLKLMGNKVAVVTTSQATKLQEKGIPEVNDYIYSYVDETLSKKTDYRRYLAFSMGDRILPYAQRQSARLMATAMTHENLMKSVGLRFSISAETALMLTFLEDSWQHEEKLPKCAALKKAAKPHPKYMETLEKVSTSKWLTYINMDVVKQTLEESIPDSPETEIPYTILQHILK